MKLLNRWLCVILGTLLCLTYAVGCAKTSSGDIQLTQETCNIIEGETVTIIAMADEEGKVSWASSDESVASVVNGEIIGKKAGKATITARFGNAVAECAVTVGKDSTPTTYLESAQDGYYLEIDQEEGLQTEFVMYTQDSEGNVTELDGADLTYKMYNKNIASIDENGLIKPLTVGPTTLTVTSGDVSCTVNVIVSTKLIRTTDDWLEVLSTTDNLEDYYYLMKDLDFSGVNYSGIGNSIEKEAEKCFRGTIDGGNHSIQNVTLNCSGGYKGLFGPLLDAKVKNIAFENITLTSGGTVVNGCGLAPSIYGNGTSFENISLELQYKKKASGNSSILAGEIGDCGSFENCLISVTSPSGNTSRDGIRIIGTYSEDITMKNVVMMCQKSVPSGVPNGIKAFTDKMEAIWAINSGKILGSDWSYRVNELPVLGM